MSAFTLFGDARAQLSGQASPFDPRTKLALLLTINAVALGRSTLLATTVCACVVIFLLWVAHVTRIAWKIALAITVGTLIYIGLPLLIPSSASIIIAGLGFWATRFAVCVGSAMWLISTTTVGELTTALERMRVPREVIIPLAVMIRFLPSVASHFRAVIDAMRLKGVIPSRRFLIFHPLRSVEFIMLPLLTTTMRMTDDLAASAVLKGLGGPYTRTSISTIGFSYADCALLGVIIALAVLRLSTAGASL